jgi:hypothetical protein
MATVGLTTKGANAAYLVAGDYWLTKVTLPVYAVPTALKAYLKNRDGSSLDVYGAIYLDDTGEPTTRLSSGYVSVPGFGDTLYTLDSSLPTFLAPGDYWLCMLGKLTGGSSIEGYYESCDSALSRYDVNDDNEPLNPYPDSTPEKDTKQWSLYLDYTPCFDNTRWKCFPHLLCAARTYTCEEGVLPSERSRDDTATVTVSCGTSGYTDVCTFRLPLPPDGILKAGTYAFLGRCWGAATCNTKVVLDVDSGTTTFASSAANPASSEADQYFTISVASDTAVTSLLTLKYQGRGVSSSKNVSIRPVHANNAFGVQADGCARTAFVGTAVNPSPGTHASPVVVHAVHPEFTADLTGVYPDDVIDLVMEADTNHTEDHGPTAIITKEMGTAAEVTDSFPAAATRRVTLTSEETQRMHVIDNTFYTLSVANVLGNAVGSLSWELLSAAAAPCLVTLNGATALTYVTTSDLEPWLEWVDPNTDTTHWQAHVYRVSDSHEMWDSTLTVAGATKVQIPASANLLSGVTYAVILLLERHEGANLGWRTLSGYGYFQVDYTNTQVKITSPVGTKDTPAVATDITPLVEWYFPKTQHSYLLSVINEDTQEETYTSGWTVSDTQSHTIPDA